MKIKQKWVFPTLLFVGVIIVYVVFWLVIDCRIDDSNIRGVFGDKFGAVNALFSGLAFAGLILTLILQREELSLQRDELEQTREELSKQRTEFETQNKNLKLQRFENSFFSLLSHYLELVRRIEYSCNDGSDYYEGHGYVVFDWFFRNKTNFDNTTFGFYGRTKDETDLAGLKNSYFKYPGLSCINQCMTFLCRVLSYMNHTDLDCENKSLYEDILFSHLSVYETVFLFYHALANNISLRDLEEEKHYFQSLNLIPVSHYLMAFPPCREKDLSNNRSQ